MSAGKCCISHVVQIFVSTSEIFCVDRISQRTKDAGRQEKMKLFVLFSLSFGAPLQKPHSEVIIVYGTFSTSH